MIRANGRAQCRNIVTHFIETTDSLMSPGELRDELTWSQAQSLCSFDFTLNVCVSLHICFHYHPFYPLPSTFSGFHRPLLYSMLCV